MQPRTRGRRVCRRAAVVGLCLEIVSTCTACSRVEPNDAAKRQTENASLHVQQLGAQGDIPYATLTTAPDGTSRPAWAAVPPFVAQRWVRGSPAGVDDLQLRWQAAWDTQYLYLRASVSDVLSSARDSPLLWDDDSLEIYLDADHSRGATYDGKNDFQYVLRAGVGTVVFGASSLRRAEGVQLTTVPGATANDYVMEIRIPWTTLGTAPAAGSQIGMDVHLNDDDDGGARDGKLATFAVSDDSWTRPSAFGSLRLGAPPAPLTDFAHAATPPRIDGVLESAEWGDAALYEVQKTLLGAASSARDLSAIWSASWDEAALYVSAIVKDERIVGDSSASWQDDSVELYLDADNSRGERYDGHDDAQYIFRVSDRALQVGARSILNTAGIRFAFASQAQGYTFEAAIPWATLARVPAADARFGIDVHVNDDDDGGDRDGKISTFAARDDAWTRPASLGEAHLRGGPSLPPPVALPPWLQYCSDAVCTPAEPLVIHACPEEIASCTPTRETTVLARVDGRAVGYFVLRLPPPAGYGSRYVSGPGEVYSTYSVVSQGKALVRSDVELTFSYYDVPASWGGTTYVDLQSESFDSSGLATHVYRHASYLGAGEPQQLHQRSTQLREQLSQVSGISLGKMTAFFLPSELSLDEGNFAFGTDVVTVNYGNPPFVEQIGDIYIQALPEFAHEYTHLLFLARASDQYPGGNLCLNEGLADAFPFAVGVLPEDRFGPEGSNDVDFNFGCAGLHPNDTHGRGNCPLWQVKRLGALTPAFAAALLNPSYVLSFDSCDLSSEQTGNAYVVLFTEAAGRDLTEAVTMAGIPNAGSYEAARAALGLP
jgi:hypothetical protein